MSETRHFIFVLTLPLTITDRVEAAKTPEEQERIIRRAIDFNSRPILRALQQEVLDQIRNPRELEELKVDGIKQTVSARTRSKGSVRELPE